MNYKIAVLGLGYVGLPLAVEFSKYFNVIGFDIDKRRVKTLLKGHDENLEVNDNQLQEVLHNRLQVTTNSSDIHNCDIYIITVPTPVDRNNKPNLKALLSASETVAEHLKPGNIVIYESTVYPGVTEEECVPVLEKASNLVFNKDFYCGYSPERINPGDKNNSLTQVIKVTSGSTPEIAKKVDDLYKKIIVAGTFQASSIRVAEAAKVIENAQRDINIAFVNELAQIFNKLNIDTHDVLEAASSKWNFLPFKPGLVGGHCIGVDPFYLAQKAQEAGYYSEIILAGRRLNDSMPEFVANEVVKLMIQKKINMSSARILLLGITFKENCPDITNSKAAEVYAHLSDYNFDIEIYDPWANSDTVREEYNISLSKSITGTYDVIVLSVPHQEFLELKLSTIKRPQGVLYDVKGVLPKHIVDKRL